MFKSFFRSRCEIQFYDIDNLNTFVYSHHLGAHKPGRLCTASPSILLYTNQANYPCEIRWLDCSVFPPVPMAGSDITQTDQGSIVDICCIQNETKQLLITALGYKGVSAYNTSKEGLEWEVKGKVPCMKRILNAARVATNGRDQVFVCDDYNDCIQMFTVDGHYMGTVSVNNDTFLGTPSRIDWCKNTSSLAVVHLKESQVGISKIKIDAEQVQRLLADALTYGRAEQQQEADFGADAVPETEQQQEANISADAVPETEQPSTSTSETAAVLPQTEEILADVMRGDSTAGITYKGKFFKNMYIAHRCKRIRKISQTQKFG